jgi:hypothetical protein
MLKTYDFKQVALIIGGVQIHGFVDGEAITVEPDSDDWNEYVGNDGETTRAKTNNGLSRVTFKLAQSSESNSYLSGLRVAGSVVPSMVKDGSGSTLHIAEQSYLKARPVSSFARETGEREWVLVCPDMQSFEGGN